MEDSERGLYRIRLAAGAELLAAAECFAQVAPIVSHLQQPAGASGHSRALGEDTVAVGGQVVALSDEYDRLVHGHAPRARLAREDALASLAATRDRWHADVHDALVRITAGGPA